ncbi:Uncharacterised protein [Mycobacterium tuberculosis]|nr:Uncharacterised protein [Mycobacterium tuberculosis]
MIGAAETAGGQNASASVRAIAVRSVSASSTTWLRRAKSWTMPSCTSSCVRTPAA